MTADVGAILGRIELVRKYTTDQSEPMQQLLLRDFPQLVAELDVAQRAAAQVDNVEEETVRQMVAQARAEERAASEGERDTAREALTVALDEQTRLVEKTRAERDEARRLLRAIRDEMQRSQIGALMERIIVLAGEGV